MTFTEDENPELKSAVVSDICKVIIAFANKKGGVLYIGVADDGTIVGIDNADKVMLQLSNMVRDFSKLAHDGSEPITRDSESHALATFSNGKKYNCGLSASYNNSLAKSSSKKVPPNPKVSVFSKNSYRMVV